MLSAFLVIRHLEREIPTLHLSPFKCNVSSGFILPINAPQNMVCMGTDTFTPRQFTRVGLYLTVIGYLLLLLFAATWWKILGLM